MYLTRLALDPRSHGARRDLSDAYEMHRTLVRACSTTADKQPSRFLWRLEPPPNAWARPVVLIQSESAPGNLQALDDITGYLATPAQSKQFAPTELVRPEALYRFRLVANPTVTRAGKRYGLSNEDSQLAWLRRQGEKHGFRPEAAAVTATDVLDSGKEGRRIVIKRVRFDGVLCAVDVPLLTAAMARGIGPGKAFGCGLLSLARC